MTFPEWVTFLSHSICLTEASTAHSNRIGAVHSSLHTTLSVLEGILEYTRNGYQYRLEELTGARRQSEEFILLHRLYQSHRTGATIQPGMLHLSYPFRWIMISFVHWTISGMQVLHMTHGWMMRWQLF